MRRWLFLTVLAVFVLAACAGDDASEAAPIDAGATSSEYFQAMAAWSVELTTRMNAADQGQPTNDDPQQNAEYRQRRVNTELELKDELAGIKPAAETADAHLKLLARFQALVDLEQRIVEELQDATSSSALLSGPLSADIEIVGGGVLVACGELLDIARNTGTEVLLFCGFSSG